MRARLALVAALAAGAAHAASPTSSTRVINLPPLTSPTGAETLYLDGPGFLAGRSMTLQALAAYLSGRITPSVPIALSGTSAIPLYPSVAIDAAPGSTLILPLGAPPGTVAIVSDRQGTASATNPITVKASFDATLLEQSPYTLTIPNESMGFRKTADGTAWQPF